MDVDWLPPAVAWAATAYKLAVLRRSPPTPAARALGGTLVWLALATTAFAPPMYVWIGEVSHVPNLAILLAQSFGMILLWPARNLLLYQRFEPAEATRRARRRYLALAPLLMIEIACWLWASIGVNDPEYVLHGASNPRVVAFFSVHHLALLAAGIDALSHGWRVGNRMRGGNRAGLRLISASGVGAVGMVTYDGTYFAAALLGAARGAWGNAELIMALMLHVSTSLLAVGATLPDWGPRVLRTVETVLALRRLRPLWLDLTSAAPIVTMSASAGHLKLSRRLNRRITEIRDAELWLGGYAPPSELLRRTAQVRRLQPADAAAWIEAAAIAGAIRAVRDGQPPRDDLDAPDFLTGAADLRGEVDHLLRVAHYYKVPKVDWVPASIAEPSDAQDSRWRVVARSEGSESTAGFGDGAP